LEYSLVPYVQFFLNNKIDGCHLLNLTADDLEDLHIFKIGHQLLILEAVELLRQLHYSLNSETLQSLAVKLGCKARSLYNDLKLNGPQDHLESMKQERISTSILSAVSEILTSVKALVSWLDRLPFLHDSLCLKLKKTVLKLSIELASTTQRDQFAEKPHSLIKRNVSLFY
ncbi:connector enhancer of kinase suppressor of ras 2, partial [Trichonephila inaurata madagascariensis]